MSYLETAISEYAAEILNKLPEETKRQINLSRQDLCSGPVYLDEEGEPCSGFDEGAKPFQFSAAIEQIEEALEAAGVESVFYEDWSGCIVTSIPDDEPPSDYREIPEEMIVEAIVGRQLAEYLH